MAGHKMPILNHAREHEVLHAEELNTRSGGENPGRIDCERKWDAERGQGYWTCPAETPNAKIQDFFIQIKGWNPSDKTAGLPVDSESLDADETKIGIIPPSKLKQMVETPEYLKTHAELYTWIWKGGFSAVDGPKGVLHYIDLQLQTYRPGKIIITGYSIGARNAIQLAQQLQNSTHRHLEITFLGLSDPAFQNETDPVRQAGVNVKAGINFFQTATRRLAADGFEFNGDIQGIKDQRDVTGDGTIQQAITKFEADLKAANDDTKQKVVHPLEWRRRVAQLKRDLFDTCHDRAVQLTYPEVLKAATAALKS